MSSGALGFFPAEQDWDVYQGDSFEIFFRLNDTVGGYVVLDGELEADVKTQRGTGSPVVSFTCTLPDQLVTPGATLWQLLPADTAMLTADVYYYDLQIELTSDGGIQTFMTGKLNITKQITVGD